MSKIRGFGFFALISCLLIGIVTGGCTSYLADANKINKSIHNDTTQIVKAATDAQGHILDADAKVVKATTTPGNPAATNALLTDAHTDLGAAQKSLAPIAPLAVSVEKKSDDAAKTTEKAVTETNKVKSGWGYRLQKFVSTLFWTFVFVGPILAIVIFIVKTNGGGPILAVIGDIAGTVFGVVWKVIKAAGTWLFHIVTLGSAALANAVNKKWDAQNAPTAAAAATPAIMPSVPPAK